MRQRTRRSNARATQLDRCIRPWGHPGKHKLASPRHRKAEAQRIKAARGKGPTRVFIAGYCLGCGSPFVGWSPTSFCSRPCKVRAKEQAKAAVSVTRRIAVALRDRGLCQACGGPVNLDVEAPHPLSISIDHVVPWSQGGTAEMGNLQLMHMRCNMAKGTKATPTRG